LWLGRGGGIGTPFARTYRRREGPRNTQTTNVNAGRLGYFGLELLQPGKLPGITPSGDGAQGRRFAPGRLFRPGRVSGAVQGWAKIGGEPATGWGGWRNLGIRLLFGVLFPVHQLALQLRFKKRGGGPIGRSLFVRIRELAGASKAFGEGVVSGSGWGLRDAFWISSSFMPLRASSIRILGPPSVIRGVHPRGAETDLFPYAE